MGLRLGAPASADVLAPQGATLRQLNDAERLFPEVPKSATPSIPRSLLISAAVTGGIVLFRSIS
ncbi:MAG: hypothetical protein HRT86_06740 [Ilumatobacteraceae bacterium]|nr:hypothetical protein [Ilumatobacteraceae bacterium]